MKRNLFSKKIIAIAVVVFIMLLMLSVNKALGQRFNTQIISISQEVNGTLPVPEIQGLNITFSYMNPQGERPQFLNIYAQLPGESRYEWVARNIYCDTFPNQRILTRNISLSQFGLPNSTRIAAINLYTKHSATASVERSKNVSFTTYPISIDTFYMFDTFTGDSANTDPVIHYLPVDYMGSVQASNVRGCNVPNVDLDKGTHPAKGTYAGDENACAPAAVANSLSWIQAANNKVGSDGLTERQRLEELSALMKRQAGGGATAEQIIQAKISFIANHSLKLKVEYRHATGNFDEDLKWLQEQYKAGQDVEIDYSYSQNGETKSHAVVLTDFKITGKVPQIAFKDDEDQKKGGGTGETTTDLSKGTGGLLTFTRNGLTCSINNLYAESYDPKAGTFTAPGSDTSSTSFCNKPNKCKGACPLLIRFYGSNAKPITTYPVCDPNQCCNINMVYTAASGECKPKGNSCKGACAPIYRSKDDAQNKRNPIQGKCDGSTGCTCIYDVTDKSQNKRDSNRENYWQDKELQEGKLKIIPNPGKQQINISVKDYEGSYRLQLINTRGEVLISKTIKLNGEEVYALDISSLANGIYKVVLMNNENFHTGKFAKL